MRHSLILGLIVLGAVLAPALAAPATLAGSWHGSGTISSRNNTDAVQCHARFTKVAGASFDISSQCTTDTGRYDISGRVDASGGNRYSGWVESNGERGNVVIVQSGNLLSVSVTGGRGSGRLVCRDRRPSTVERAKESVPAEVEALKWSSRAPWP